MYKSDLLKELNLRGFLNNCTNFQLLDEKLLKGEKFTLYLGSDLTAKSFHIGHMVPILMMRIFQKHGHKPIVLLGGGTTKIGDPSFKNTARPILSDVEIAQNFNSMKKVLTKFLDFEKENLEVTSHQEPYDKTKFNNKAIIINNNDWLSRLNYIDFLKKIGAYFSINRMITFDMVKSKLENNISFSFLEFNYMIMQSYDFLELYEKYDCNLQIGGQDQWGNILCGVDLIHKYKAQDVFGLTTNLLLKKDGSKMGKTANGAIWLDRDFLSEYDFWQYFRNTADEDVDMLLKIMTNLDLEKIEELSKLNGAEKNRAKIILADEVTKLVHSDNCLDQIHGASNAFYSNSLESLAESKSLIYSNIADATNFIGNKGIVDVLVEYEISASRSEAKKLIRAGAVDVNGRVVDENFAMRTLEIEKLHKLKVGKKNLFVFQIVNK